MIKAAKSQIKAGGAGIAWKRQGIDMAIDLQGQDVL
jgi:hypothetical protein